MGQAKRRGTREERMEQALQRKQRATEEARNARPLVRPSMSMGGHLAVLLAATMLGPRRR